VYQPEIYWVVLSFMLVSMLCWGSWANAVKLCPGYRFQLFYWDYVIGLAAAGIVWGLTLGSFGSAGAPFLQDISGASRHAFWLAFAGGAVFNVANLLLVAAIDIAGLAVAFPVAIGLALVVGAVGNYILSPKGNPLLLFGGIVLVVAAIVLDAMAYRQRDVARADDQPAFGAADGKLLSPRRGGDEWRARDRTVRSNAILLYRCGCVRAAGELSLYALSAGREPARENAGIPTGALKLARGWGVGWGDLVHGSAGKLSRIKGKSGRTRRLLFHWPGSDHDLCRMGRLRLARVCIGSAENQGAAGLDVHFISVWTGNDCNCTSFLMRRIYTRKHT